MIKARSSIRESNRHISRPLAKVRRDRQDRALSDRWYSERAVPIAISDTPSETPSQTNVSTVSNVIQAIMSQQLSQYSLYEMTADEVKKKRIEIYRLNATGKYQFYTRYLDGRYLMVIRMK